RFLEGRGYRRERLGRVWELDLNERRDHILAMTEVARAHMREQGVDLRTFDGWDDRRALEKLYELTMAAYADVPSTQTFVPNAFENWKLWLTSPGIHKERFWLALEGDRLLGLSVLAYPGRGHVTTDFTGVARDARGR